MKVSKKLIKKAFQRDDLDPAFVAELRRLLNEYGDAAKIDTPIRLTRFLAQAVSETQIKKSDKPRLRENLNYSAKGLKGISSYFRKHPKQADRYGRTKDHKANQKAIANLMYADKNRPKRLRLGNVWAGDGWAFRGAGLFQTTGRSNMQKDLKTVEKLFGISAINPQTKQPYKGILDNYTMFIMLGMAHWYRTKMWKLNSTNAITDKINAGLPKKLKRQRLATAKRIARLVFDA